MARIALSVDVPDNFEAIVVVRPKTLPLQPELAAQSVIEAPGETVQESRPNALHAGRHLRVV